MSAEWERPATFVEGFHDEAVVRQMEYRHLPNVGLVSVLAFGASGLGGMHTAGAGTGVLDAAGLAQECTSVWWQEDPESDVEAAREVLLAYLKAGGNVIDTAHWYGQGKAERLLGRALEDVPRQAYYLLTKIGRYDKTPADMFDFSYERTWQAVRDSIKRLRVDYIDVVQVHDPEYAPDVDDEGSRIVVHHAVRALHEAKEAGLCRGVGMTGYPIGTQEKLIRQCFAAGYPIQTSLTYCRLTLNDRSLLGSAYLATCRELGVGVINASPISMGLLMMGRDPPGWHPAPEAAKKVCKAAADYCAGEGVDLSRLALKYVLGFSELPTTLVSTTSPQRCTANIRSVSEPLTAKEKQVLDHLVNNIFKPAGDLSWEGIEVGQFWKTISRDEVLRKYAASPPPAKKAG